MEDCLLCVKYRRSLIRYECDSIPKLQGNTGGLLFTCDPPRLIRREAGTARKPLEAEYPVDLVYQPQFETFPHWLSLLRCDPFDRSGSR